MRTLIIGSSGGIGRAMVEVLADEGHEVCTLSRSANGLDLSDEKSIASCLNDLGGEFDLVVVATGALEIDGQAPEKSLKALQSENLLNQFAVNAIGPALVLKHVRAYLPRDRRSVFMALSARVGSIGDNQLGGWYGYRAAKAALNQLIHTASIELARSHKELVCVVAHPGTVATNFTRNYANHAKITPAQAAQKLLAMLDGLTPADSGKFFDNEGGEIVW